MSELEIKHSGVFTKNYEALTDNKIRFIINMGGTRSSKTYSICQLIIVYCLQNPGKLVSVVRKSFPSLRATVYRDMVEILTEYKLYDIRKHNKTDNIITFDNGSKIEFFSLDDSQKIRGRKRDLLFMNEANELGFEEFNQLNFRTNDKVVMDFNPSSSEHFIYDMMDKPESIKIHSTFRDNPFLDSRIVKEIESLKDTDFDLYQIYNLGLPSKSTHTIYNHQKPYIDELLSYDDVIWGLDFGYQHPTALIKCSFKEDMVFTKEVIYESYLTTEDLIEKMRVLSIPKNDIIVCDYARPEIIEELRRAGYNCMNAIKNVKEGIDAVKSYKLFYHNDSLNLQKELRNYKWKSIGERILDEPIKLWDDACFVGETLITTDKGLIQIKDIEPGDMVLTSKGYKKVLIKHNNGFKPIKNYRMKGDTFDIYISSTPEHKVKTNKGWKEISTLQSGMMVTLHKPSMVKNINFTTVEDISCNINTTCITKYGSSIMELEEKGITYTTLMEIVGTTESKTLKRLRHSNTYQNMVKICQKNIRRNGMKLVLKRQKNGMVAKRVGNGTRYMVRNAGKVESMLRRYVKNVVLNMKQDMVEYPSSVTTTVKLSSIEELEKKNMVSPMDSDIKEVYDLTVEDVHEYYANGLLVHNCDAMRYAILYHKKSNNRSGTTEFMVINI